MTSNGLHLLSAQLTRVIRDRIRRAVLSGDARECPVCSACFRRFLSAGKRKRSDARCPECGSLERHRLAWLYLSSQTTVFSVPTRLLHLAPERCLSERFEATPGLQHFTADIAADGVTVRADLQVAPFADASFNVIYCSHVLEHVDDDRAALRSLHRMLRPGGWALIQVPITERGRTVEDPSVRSPEERARLFGQADHVRAYGCDAAERFRDAGFAVEAIPFARTFSPEQARRFGVDRDELLFVCRKGADG